MSSSGSISQLLKGIIIGIVLIMAIIGTMSLLQNGNPITSFLTEYTEEQNASNLPAIEAPAITVNPNTAQTINQNQDNTTIGDLNAVFPSDGNTQTPSEPTDETQVNNTSTDTEETELTNEPGINDVVTEESTAEENKPVLEDETTAEELNSAPAIGMMTINTINPSDSTEIKADYAVYDKNDVKVIESKDVSKATYRLPVGQYKVETTLNSIDSTTQKVTAIDTKNRYAVVKEDTNARYTFELEPPSNLGVLQVSAEIAGEVVRANFAIQKADGEVIASRNNVASSLFQLDAGSYKVMVTNGDNTDFKSVEIIGGESLETTFDLKQGAQQGRLIINLLSTDSNTPVRGDILISSQDDTVVQELKASASAELSLAQGNYKITVTGPGGISNKNISVISGQTLNEVFRFNTPNTDGTSITQIDNADNVTDPNTTIIKAVEEPESTALDINNNGRASFSVFAKDANSKEAIPSNIYIQTPQGENVVNRTYVESATFDLIPGTYKVTVKATDRENMVKTVRLEGNKKISETFNLIDPSQPQNITPEPVTNVEIRSPNAIENTATIRPSESVLDQPNTVQAGFLNVSIRAPRNQTDNNVNLNSNFIVSKESGEKIAELKDVSNGNLKLDAGDYDVTAIHQNERRTQRITITANQNSRLVFRTSDFQNTSNVQNTSSDQSSPNDQSTLNAQQDTDNIQQNTPNYQSTLAKGTLTSNIVSQTGQPLIGTLIVRNAFGQIVAQRDNVSSAVFELPPTAHTISLVYLGSSASENIQINLNQTTVQTFTIATN